ncbi:putative deacetylase [Mrakia frigida]|uniref:putative deacetylase n=1 Tax=Mrakia frigida TaxID=29902 RepID=UPI003FCC118C
MLLPQLVVLSALLTLVSSLPWSNLLERQEASSSALNDIPTINLVYNCTVAGHFALTFDDGPYLWEKTVGDAFTAGNQLTTFFLNGNNYGCIYDSADVVKELYDANHTMASHGWGHLNMGLLDADAINSELERLEVAFTRILGVVPRFFRPPFGSYSTLLLEILAQRGYTHVYLWDTDSQDADGATASVQTQLFDANCATYPLSHLALQHSPVEQTITTVLPYALAELRKTRYTVSTVEDCLGLRKEDAYRVVGTPGTRDATWTCA